MLPLIANLGPTELLIILGILILLCGATKLPDLAGGIGRALRIFKDETDGLLDKDRHDLQSTTPHAEAVSRHGMPPAAPGRYP
jgi:sec-independent protein translocase protein TatA